MNRWPVSVRLLACLSLVLFLLACAGGVAAPSSSAEPTRALAMPTAGEAPPETEQPGDPQFPIIAVPPSVPENRRLTLEYPPRIRAGDSDIIRLVLEVDPDGKLLPTAVVEGNVVTGEAIQIPNLYETHHVVAEARFDVAGLEVRPPGTASQVMMPGQTVRFFWSVRPPQAGTYRGTIWLHLRFADKVTGAESQTAVSAQVVEIQAVELFGLSADVVRIAGGAGSLIGGILGFPFLEDIVRYVWGRRRKKSA